MAVEFSFGRGSPAPILMTIYILKNDTDVLYQSGRTVGSLTHFHRKFPISKPGCNDMCKENLRWGNQAFQVKQLAKEGECRDFCPSSQTSWILISVPQNVVNIYDTTQVLSQQQVKDFLTSLTIYSPLTYFKDCKSIPGIG